MERSQRRSFTDDYKRQAVDLVVSSGRSIGSVPKELGLRDLVLRRWVELRGAGRGPTAASRRPTTQATLASADHAAEIARLQRAKGGREFAFGCVTGDINDILVAVVDGLKGFPEAITSVFPQTMGRPASLCT